MAGNHMSEQSPRQRMINMMYLVLTALLALNVSKKVLDAFHKMDESIGSSYSEKLDFNEKSYRDFELRAMNNPGKLGEWNNIAKSVKEATSDMIAMIDTVRFKIKDASGLDEDGVLKQKDNKELTIKILVKDKENKGYGYGQLLRAAREEYKDFLLSLDSIGIYDGDAEVYKINIMQLLRTESVDEDGPDGPKQPTTWEHNQYYGHVPAAAMAFMNQMKLDVGNMEGAILELIQQKTGQSSITVNSQLPVVTSERETIMLGDSFSANVFIAGVDTNQLPKFNVYKYNSDGERIDDIVIDTLDVQGAEGYFSVKPVKQGTYYFGGDIVVQSEEGEKKYEFKKQYRVDAPMSVISPDKMNVLYTEVEEQPVSISVPGYSSDELTLHSDYSKCKIKRVKNGTYNIFIPKQTGKDRKKEIKLSVRANNKAVGKPIVFRVKKVPPPYPSIAGVVGYGEITKTELSRAPGIAAKLDNFDFDLKFKVVSATMTYQGSGGAQNMEIQGNRFEGQVKTQLSNIKRGQLVVFRDIKYKIVGSKAPPAFMPGSITIKVK